MAALGNRVITTTNYKLMPKLVDTILHSNVFATRMLANAKKWSGLNMQFPIKWQKGVAGTSFSGYQTFSTSASDTRVNLLFVPKFYETNVSLPLDEISANQTDERVLDLAKLEIASRAQDMADSIGTLFFGDSSGNGSQDFNGLSNIVDNGSDQAVYGSLNRNTYPTIQATVTASGGTLSLAKMSTLYNTITSGTQKPTVGICPPSVFSLYEALLQPQERVVKDVGMMKNENKGLNSGTGLIGGTGFTGLYFKGFPILADEKASTALNGTGNLYFLNEDFIDFYALPLAMTEPVKYKTQDIEGNDYSEVEGLGFSWSNWIKPTNSASVIGHVYLGGELICDNPLRQGVLTGCTSV